MTTATSEEIRIGPLAIRFRIESEASGGSVAVFEFDVPARANVPIAHSHDAYEETLYGLEGTLTWTLNGERQEGFAAPPVGSGEATVEAQVCRALGLIGHDWPRLFQ